jgi:hypothetical protein
MASTDDQIPTLSTPVPNQFISAISEPTPSSYAPTIAPALFLRSIEYRLLTGRNRVPAAVDTTYSMKALGYNCQGMGKNLLSPKMCYLAKMISSTKPQVTFVSEIKSAKVKSSDLVTRFSMNDSIIVPSRRCSGGFWLMWTDEINVSIHSIDFHVILATFVNNTNTMKFGLICIYGDPYHQQTSQIWEQVASFAHDNYSLPMLCIGDMNEFLYHMDKNYSNVNRSRMNAFWSLVKHCGFFDLGFSGPAYTWTNKRFSSKPTFERLDR